MIATPTVKPDISGRLEAFHLFEILGLLRDKAHSGRLHVVVATGEEFEVLVSDGAVVLAQRLSDPFFDRLVASVGADREMVQASAELHGDWLQALATLGHLQAEEVGRLLREQCVRIGLAISSFESGTFDFYLGPQRPLADSPVDILYLQLEIARRLDETKRSLPPELGGSGTRIRVLHDPWEIDTSLSLVEWRLVHAIALKGPSPPLEVVWDDDLFEDPAELAKTLQRLAAEGILEIQEGDPLVPPPHQPEAPPSPEDVPEETANSNPSTVPTTKVPPDLIASVSVLRPSEIEVHAEFQLVELRDGHKVRHYPLRDSTSVGRAESNDICLSHESISRRHAIFSEAGKAVLLQIVGKSNPALVDGQRFVSGWLKGGESIVFYPYCFLLEGKAQVRPKERD